MFGIEIWRFKIFKKNRYINQGKHTLKSKISTLECPRMVHISNFYISNEGVYSLDVELRYVVSKLRKKLSFPNYGKISLNTHILTSKCPRTDYQSSI